MINVGIIGCGKIAQLRHITEYKANEDAKLYGFYDTNRKRAGDVSAPFHGTVYSSYEDLLADKNIDAVSILTPNHTHAEITVAALNSGKHVLCEKPMATNLADCELMAETAKKTGQILMIAQNQRFTPAHVKAKELIQSGILGKILTFRTSFCHSGADSWSIDGKNSWFMDKNKGCFGALADLGIHKTDLMVYLLDKKIVKAAAIIQTLDKRDMLGNFISVDDNAFCTYVMEDNVIGTMNASWTNYGKEDNSTSIYGTEGVIHIYKDPSHSIVIERLDKPDEYYDIGEIQTNDNQSASGVIDEFINSIRDNTGPKVPAEDVLPAMKAIFACDQSNENNGIWIDIS